VPLPSDNVVVPPVPVPPVPVPPVPVPPSLDKFCPLPQAASSARDAHAIIDNLRISFHPRSTGAGVSRDLILPARFLA
jgi:hypothetical protein